MIEAALLRLSNLQKQGSHYTEEYRVVRAVTSIFLSNTLAAILETIQETPDLDPKDPALLDFERSLIQRIHELRTDEQFRVVAEGNSCISLFNS